MRQHLFHVLENIFGMNPGNRNLWKIFSTPHSGEIDRRGETRTTVGSSTDISTKYGAAPHHNSKVEQGNTNLVTMYIFIISRPLIQEKEKSISYDITCNRKNLEGCNRSLNWENCTALLQTLL